MMHDGSALINSEQESLIVRVFDNYVTEHHHEDVLQLAAHGADHTHHAVVINAMTLFEDNMEVGDYFNMCPLRVLDIFDQVLHQMVVKLSKDPRPRCSLHARITGLPVCPELTRDTIPRSRDVGHFLSITGTVIRTSVVKVLEFSRDYMCVKCRHVFTVEAEFSQFYALVSPGACPNPDGCRSSRFSCLSGDTEPASCRDYQEIRIQEQVQRLAVGSIPRSMVVVLEDDLVDGCKSGDDVTVYGVVCQRWRPFRAGDPCDVDLVLKANNMEVTNQQAASVLLLDEVQKDFEDFWDSFSHAPLSGRDHILGSLCPQVFGMYVIKLAVALVMAGGVQRVDASGTKVRGECHMLLVGDPGTGKSQFLKYAAKVMPRSVLTAGMGSTSAGLTVAAVKDGGEWHLEAGALVLSDGGLCCIDEFNSIKEQDRISIHEAMEQQSISVAKAGMVCKLNTRTTILAATNPKGPYDPLEPLSVNVALASPLLSRFDLVLVLLDTRNAAWDQIISSFILEDKGGPAESSSLWSMEKMRAYFCVIKRLQPQLSQDANAILTSYYQLQRQSHGRSAARTTIRMLESLSRLAEAHAKLMYRETVTVEDAVMAVSLMECSMQGRALLGNVNALLTSFPADPTQQYETQLQVLLEGLKLPRLLHKEKERLARMKTGPPGSNQPTNQNQPPPSDAHLTDQSSSNPLSGDGDLDWFTVMGGSASSSHDACAPVTSTQRHVETRTTRQRTGTLAETKQRRDQHKKETSTRNDDKETDDPPRGRSTGGVVQQVSKDVGDNAVAGGERAGSAEQHPSTSNTLASGQRGRFGDSLRDTSCGREPRRWSGGHTVDGDENLLEKLSEFRFKPRKMSPGVTNPDPESSSKVHDKLDFEEGFRTSRRNTESCADGVTGVTGKDARANGQNHLGPMGSGRRPLTSTHEPQGGATDGFCRTSPSYSDLVPSMSDKATPTVASSTLAKLARFSFAATTENRTTSPETGSRTLPCSPSGTENQVKGLHSSSEHNQTRTSPTQHVLQKTQSGRAATRNATAPRTRPRHNTVTKWPAEARPAEPLPPEDLWVSDRLHQHQSTVNIKKRKCFELAPPPPPPTQPFTPNSLFGCDEVSDDVLDTDWEQEVSKKTKI